MCQKLNCIIKIHVYDYLLSSSILRQINTILRGFPIYFGDTGTEWCSVVECVEEMGLYVLALIRFLIAYEIVECLQHF